MLLRPGVGQAVRGDWGRSCHLSSPDRQLSELTAFPGGFLRIPTVQPPPRPGTRAEEELEFEKCLFDWLCVSQSLKIRQPGWS